MIQIFLSLLSGLISYPALFQLNSFQCICGGRWQFWALTYASSSWWKLPTAFYGYQVKRTVILLCSIQHFPRICWSLIALASFIYIASWSGELSIQSDTLYNIMFIICTTYNVQFWHCKYFPQRNFYKRLYEMLSSSHKTFLKSILISASGEMKYQVLWLIRLQKNVQRKGLRRLT